MASPCFGGIEFTLDSVSRVPRETKQVAPTPAAVRPAVQAPETGVTWDDICGQSTAKAALLEAVVTPIKHADVYRRYGRKPTKGVLLCGPPGNGKTMLAKAVATAVRELYANARDSGPSIDDRNEDPTMALARRLGMLPPAEASKPPRAFISVKGPELFDKYLGETEKKIRALFDEARKHKRRFGFPSIIFIDEAEALMMSRSGDRSGLASITVPAFLAEMDGLDDSGAIVILATNLPDNLDASIVRDGRIDRKIRVGGPDRDTAAAIITKALSKRPLASELEGIVERALAALYDPRHALYRVHVESGNCKTVALHHVISGAAVVGIVERATSRAIEREIGADAGAVLGISADDFEAEVKNTLEESRSVLHRDEIAAFCEGLGPVQVERVTAGGAGVATAWPKAMTVTSGGQA